MKNNRTAMEINHDDVKRCIREAIAYVYFDTSAEERALLLQNTWVNTAEAISQLATNIHESDTSELVIRRLLINLLFDARQIEIDTP